ncbi:MAG: AraC family transcriptional regulator, partial [Ginsengibacter sp.]
KTNNMQSVTNKTISNREIHFSKHKVLEHNGTTAVEFRSHTACSEGSMFVEENTLLFISAGTFEIRYGDATYKLNKNQCAFLKKDTLIEYEMSFDQDCEATIDYIKFTLRHELVKEFIKLTELSITAKDEVCQVIINMPDKKFVKYIESLEPYFVGEGRVEDSLVKIKLLELLFCLASNDTKVLEQVLDLREHFRMNITTTVEENLMNSISLNQLAVLSGRSLSSFRRDFLAIYNMPPSQWIRQKKLEKSKELLVSTTMTVTDICYTTGFENIAHFSRLFKSQFGCPPSGFRMARLAS